jgi:hypothetical protein
MKQAVPNGRAGLEGNIKNRTHQLSVYLEPPIYDQLRELAFVERTKMHTLILEGLDLVFQKRALISNRPLIGIQHSCG